MKDKIQITLENTKTESLVWETKENKIKRAIPKQREEYVKQRKTDPEICAQMCKNHQNTQTHTPCYYFTDNFSILLFCIKQLRQYCNAFAAGIFSDFWIGDQKIMWWWVWMWPLQWRIVEVLHSIQALLYELDNEKHFTFNDIIKVIFSY